MVELLPMAVECTVQESTPTERRLRSEWALLCEVARLNPMRLSALEARDQTFYVTLRATPALDAAGGIVTEHRLRLAYPRFFPAVPMELYLEQPMVHPNLHPVTGFVCLWQTHRVEYGVEHALHRAVAMLGWRLLNAEPRHVMQPESLGLDRAEMQARLQAPPLTGVEHAAQMLPAEHAARRRRRLS